jgi:hypothetical protein
LSCVIFLILAIINVFLFGELSPERPIYSVIMSSVLFAMICGLTNIFFVFNTLDVFWDSLSHKDILKYFMILIILNIFSAYFFVRLWNKKSNIKMYSLSGKRKFGLFDPIAFYFYFFSFIAFTVPMFIVSMSI